MFSTQPAHNHFGVTLTCSIYYISRSSCKGTIPMHAAMHMKSMKIPKGVIRIRNSKEDRQHNDQQKKYKQQSTKHTHKTKDRLTRNPLKSGGELRCSGRVRSSCSTYFLNISQNVDSSTQLNPFPLKERFVLCLSLVVILQWLSTVFSI
jgi:hypothetical protein